MATVHVSIVIKVLEKALQDTDCSFYCEGNTVTIIRDESPMVFDLPDEVPRKMLHKFDYEFGVKIEYFYHPNILGI